MYALMVFALFAGAVTCAPISSSTTRNPNWIPYENLNQTWGLKGMTLADYRSILADYLNTYLGGNYSVDTLPGDFKNDRLVIKNGTSDYAYFLSVEDYAQQEADQTAECDLQTDLCIIKCYHQIWYPGYENDVFRYTKHIVMDWNAYIKEKKVKDHRKYEPPTGFDYEDGDWDDDEVQIIT